MDMLDCILFLFGNCWLYVDTLINYNREQTMP